VRVCTYIYDGELMCPFLCVYRDNKAPSGHIPCNPHVCMLSINSLLLILTELTTVEMRGKGIYGSSKIKILKFSICLSGF